MREEMDRAGALELLMPAVQPAELWQESGRWSEYGPELLRLKDRHERDFVIGPTHEEVITDIARRELKSYRQLPVNFYQIQLKFRDEVRPRFGVMRAREFIMKDAYSFHVDEPRWPQGYAAMRAAYTRMFQRMGLDFRVVQADTGAIGGTPRRNSRCSPPRARTPSRSPTPTTTPPMSSSPRRCRPRRHARAPGAPLERIATPGARTIERAQRAARRTRPRAA